MDSRSRRRGANTVTVITDTTPPPHISRAALLFSLVAAVVAIITQFTRLSIPLSPLPRPDSALNITSISDLVHAVFDAPQRGHFFRTGCFSRRSLRCHTVQHISYVLDGADVSDDGDSYVFRVSKHNLHAMKRNIQLRRETLNGCTPWQYGTFFMKFDWFLLYFLPRTIASKLFATSFTEGGYRRDRWGWCAETIPFNTHHVQPAAFRPDSPHQAQEETSYDPTGEFSRESPASEPPNDVVEEQTRGPASDRATLYRHIPGNHAAHLQRNIMYA